MDSLDDAQRETKEIVSPSLIKTPPSVNWSDYESFDLGLDPEWQWPTNQSEENVPPPPEQVEPEIKKPRLSLSLKKVNKGRHSEDRELQVAKDITNTKPHITAGVQQNRFALPVSENHLKKAASGIVPENTRCNTQWALGREKFHELGNAA